MNEVIAIFISQFLAVYLLGIQSLNVRDGKKVLSAICSLLIGVTFFYNAASIGEKDPSDMLTPFGISFLLAGPLAIVAAIWSHPTIIRIFHPNGK